MLYEFLTGDDARRASILVGQKIKGCERGWDKCVALVAHNHGIKGIVLFHDFDPDSGTMCLSAMGEGNWLTRKLICLTHDYIFGHCQLAIWQVSEDNKKMNRVAEGLGYTPHRIPRLSGRDQAGIIWTLTDDDWQQSRFKR